MVTWALDNSKVYVQSWSGGKDSTASIVLEHMHRERLGIPPSKVVMAEVMFDNKRGISGEMPDHVEWVYTVAKPIFESWGHEVIIKRSEMDFMDCFYRVVKNSKEHHERNGKYVGFPIGGACTIQRDLKLKTIRQIRKEHIREDTVEFIGIAADETARFGQLNAQMRSLLREYNVHEIDTYKIVRPYNLLSPVYAYSRRGGCWFCPNQSYHQLSLLKKHHPELWDELRELSYVENTVSRSFKWGETFDDVERKVDMLIASPEQMKIF